MLFSVRILELVPRIFLISFILLVTLFPIRILETEYLSQLVAFDYLQIKVLVLSYLRLRQTLTLINFSSMAKHPSIPYFS